MSFECKVHSVIRIQGDSLVGHSDIVIGRVVGIHVKGEYITPDGVSKPFYSWHMFQFQHFTNQIFQLFDVLKAAPLARLGYHQYTAINNIFEMKMPFMPDDFVSGGVLSGSSGDKAPERIEPAEEEQELRN